MLNPELDAIVRNYLALERELAEVSNALHARMADLLDETESPEREELMSLLHVLAEFDSGAVSEESVRSSLKRSVPVQ